MRNRAAFQTQLALIMEALAKAAVAEISKLVEDGTCVLRLEVSRSHKEIDGLRRKLQQVERELRTARDAAKRDSRSAEVQDEDEFGAARGADKGGTDVAFVEHLSERKGKAQIRDRRPIFRFTVKEEHERDEESVAQILHQAESEHSAGRLNNVGPETVLTEPVSSLTPTAYSCRHGDAWKLSLIL
ncbi:hypothetical protein GJAV_G00093590 [Gymnothorax javanicus]|nr:hypothetical protein GJAV_G00093590 [Gymnothorax javanicus]